MKLPAFWKTLAVFVPPLMAIFLQFSVIDRHALHEDEAIYSSWARDILNGRPLLTTNGVDKPPVTFYLQAISMLVLGEHERATRTVGIISTVASLLLVFALVRRTYGDSSEYWTLLLCALSPTLNVFGPTAFTDPVAVALGLAFLLSVMNRRWASAGIFLVCATFTKQYLLLYGLLMAIWWVVSPAIGPSKAELLRFFKWTAIAFAPFAAWSTFFNNPSWFFLKGVVGAYEVWTDPHSLTERFSAWLAFMHFYTGSTGLNLLCAVVAILFIAKCVSRYARRQVVPREDSADLLWLWMTVGYFGLLIAQPSLPLWHRYVLPAAPLLLIFLSRMLFRITSSFPTFIQLGAYGVLGFIMLGSLKKNVLDGNIPEGTNYAIHDGIKEIFRTAHLQLGGETSHVFYEGSGFLPRWYAYRSPLSITAQDRIADSTSPDLRASLVPIYAISLHSDSSLADLVATSGNFWHLNAERVCIKNYCFTKIEPSKHAQAMLKHSNLARLFNARAVKIEGSSAVLSGSTSLFDAVASFTSEVDNLNYYRLKEAGHEALRFDRAQTWVHVDLATLAQKISQKNKGLDISLLPADQNTSIGITCAIPTFFNRSVTIKAQAMLHLSGPQKVQPQLLRVDMAGMEVPRPAVQLINKMIPAQRIRLPEWMGSIRHIEVNPRQGNLQVFAVAQTLE